MIGKAIFSLTTIALSASIAYAAGGEINAKINQDSTISSSKVLGAPSVELQLGEIPIIGGVSVGVDLGQTKINEIDNTGKLGGTVTQTSNIQDTVVVGSTMNTIQNAGIIGEESEITQTNTMNGSGNVVVGTSVNSIKNN